MGKKSMGKIIKKIADIISDYAYDLINIFWFLVGTWLVMVMIYLSICMVRVTIHPHEDETCSCYTETCSCYTEEHIIQKGE